MRGNNPYLAHAYYTSKGWYNAYLSNYGSYDHLIEGFISIRNRFADFVLPLVGITPKGDQALGSCFAINTDTIITAKHCIQDVAKFQILDKDKKLIPIADVYFASDNNVDIAVIKTQGKYFEGTGTDIRKLHAAYDNDRLYSELSSANYLDGVIALLGEGRILDDILTLGYPPVAEFDSMLIASKSQINSTYLRSSAREILAKEAKYYHDLEYLVINSKVKGGNSGGPIFNSLGLIVGVIVQMPAAMENQNAFDQLGYGLAIPSSVIKQMLDAIILKDDRATKQSLHPKEDYFSLHK
jgi:serine protease Do